MNAIYYAFIRKTCTSSDAYKQMAIDFFMQYKMYLLGGLRMIYYCNSIIKIHYCFCCYCVNHIYSYLIFQNLCLLEF